MGNLKINDIVKGKIDKFKNKSGSKTYSDAINLLFAEYYPLKSLIITFENKWEEVRLEKKELQKRIITLQENVEVSQREIERLYEVINDLNSEAKRIAKEKL